MFPPPTVWNYLCTGTLPTPNVRHSLRSRGSGLHDGRCPSAWQDPRGTRQAPGERTPAYGGGRYDTKQREVPLLTTSGEVPRSIHQPDGVHPDQGKVRAIQEFKIPQNVADIRRFLGMCNHLSKFAPNLADKTQPLRELLNKRNEWVWGEPQRAAFKEVKEILMTSPVLALFDQKRETVVSAAHLPMDWVQFSCRDSQMVSSSPSPTFLDL